MLHRTALLAAFAGFAFTNAVAQNFTLNEREYFSTRGLDVLVFSNTYDGNFSDSKIAGIELIHHGVRTATNGDVRLSPTPEQWDPVPALKSRTVREGAVEAKLAYTSPSFEYTVRAEPAPGGIVLKVVLEQPLPRELEGRAGFNLEFLPSAYFSRTWLVDDASGVFPLYPAGPTGRDASGKPERKSSAAGRRIVLAPEDAERRVTVESRSAPLALFDGRNQAQNGWFVIRSLIPAGATGTVVEWFLQGNTIPGWTRPAVITHSQVGYHPSQSKVAVIECDRNAAAPAKARLLRVGADGSFTEVLTGEAKPWGEYLRYRYFNFDFSAVKDPGVYVIEAAGARSSAFRIAPDVYATAWQPTLDVFFPVQMDHMFVNEAYRVWHGASHLDDARQAPINHEHFDLYAQGPSTDSPFEPGEHIPGLNIGGWFDAGDFDLRTQTHYATVMAMVDTWERFRPGRDETTIDQNKRHVEMHHPDGVPDLLQQIEHGTLMLIAQHRVFGHAIPGIVEPDLGQYTHLGDAVTKTDNNVDDPSQADSPRDDRLAFTTATTALNYGSAAALAAASRALRGYRDALADECLATAKKVWDFEKSRQPNLFKFGNTTGGDPQDEEIRAAVELLITTGDKRYAQRLNALWRVIHERFARHAADAIRVLPKMDAAFGKKLRTRAAAYRNEMKESLRENPFGVPITRGGWAGSGAVVDFATTAYYLHRTYPDLYARDDALAGLEFLYGRHPGSNLSFVSGVGTQSKTVAYGSNRADFSFIAGGVVPGVLILKPDFPENKEDWPFLWGENEYVIGLAASYLFLVHAADELLNGT
jgi:endoglucanase